MKNYYDILDLTQDASKVQIKEAYRTLAKKYHPDSNSGNDQLSDLLKEVNEAKDVLSDKFKKIAYDQSLIQHKLSAMFGHPSPGGNSTCETKIIERTYTPKLQKLGITVGLLLLLAIFMLYLFPIHDNEWEMANNNVQNTTEVYYASNAVDDLFGRDENHQPSTLQVNGAEQAIKAADIAFSTISTAPEIALENANGIDNNKALNTEKLLVAATSIKANVATKKNAIENIPAAPISLNKVHELKIPNENVVTATKIEINSIPATPETPVKKPTAINKVPHLMTEQEMARVLGRLETQKLNFSNTTKCIQIAKTGTSNVSNAFDMADFLTKSGYAISGRKIVSGSNKGVAIDIKKSGCITLIIGVM